jgi:hypothetical protein
MEDAGSQYRGAKSRRFTPLTSSGMAAWAARSGGSQAIRRSAASPPGCSQARHPAKARAVAQARPTTTATTPSARRVTPIASRPKWAGSRPSPTNQRSCAEARGASPKLSSIAAATADNRDRQRRCRLTPGCAPSPIVSFVVAFSARAMSAPLSILPSPAKPIVGAISAPVCACGRATTTHMGCSEARQFLHTGCWKCALCVDFEVIV